MRIRPIDLVDVLVYLVVLGVFIQIFPQVISESFLLALLTAILLKVVLEVVVWVKKLMLRGVRSTPRIGLRVLGGIALLLVLAGSKFLVLELTAIAFRGEVQLGGFVQVTALIAVLMAARAGTRALLVRRRDQDA